MTCVFHPTKFSKMLNSFLFSPSLSLSRLGFYRTWQGIDCIRSWGITHQQKFSLWRKLFCQVQYWGGNLHKFLLLQYLEVSTAIRNIAYRSWLSLSLKILKGGKLLSPSKSRVQVLQQTLTLGRHAFKKEFCHFTYRKSLYCFSCRNPDVCLRMHLSIFSSPGFCLCFAASKPAPLNKRK